MSVQSTRSEDLNNLEATRRFRIGVWKRRLEAAKAVMESSDTTVSGFVEAIRQKNNAELRLKALNA